MRSLTVAALIGIAETSIRAATVRERSGALPAAGARVEVQVNGIAGHGDTNKVTDINSQAFGRMSDMHVICLYWEIQFAGLAQYILAEGFIRLILAVHTACNFFHVRL